MNGICQTLCSRMGTGGNNVPLTLSLREGVDESNKSRVYGICSDQSNAMLSDNPRSGIYEAVTSRTLDRNGGNPCCNQGGMAVVEPVSSNFKEEHAVYSMTTGSFTSANKEIAPPIMARDYKDPPVVGRDEVNRTFQSNYLVRRLTPGECCRLQGFPDGWCENLGDPAPSDDEIDRWEQVFEEYRQAVGGTVRIKSRTQIEKWLRDPHSDAAEYKAYGNSVAVPCVFFVLAGIVWAEEHESSMERSGE